MALDPATKENGCLQVLRGSHKLGRLDHGTIGTQSGVDTVRMQEVEKHFEKVYVEMTLGSVLFFHSNLLHCSGPNNSDKHRRSFIMCYNAIANPITSTSKYKNTTKVCPVGEDGAILKFAS